MALVHDVGPPHHHPAAVLKLAYNCLFFVIRRIYLIYSFIFGVKFASNKSQENLKRDNFIDR